MIWTGHVQRVGEIRSAYAILVRKSERKRPLGRLTYGWEENIIMDLREIWLGIVRPFAQDSNE